METVKSSVLFVLMISALAGCIGGGEPAGTPTPIQGSDDGGSGGNGTADPGVVVAAFEIRVDGNLSQPVNGSHAVALGANVSLDASASQGANLSFAWDLGDGNTTTGPNTTIAYAAVGNYTIVLTVTDAEGASDTASANLTVASAGPAPGTVLTTERKTFSGTLTNPLAEIECGDTAGEGLGFMTFSWELVGAQPDGTMSRVNKIAFAMTTGPTAIDYDVYFYDPAGKEVGSSHGFEPLDGPESFTVEKVLEPGAYSLVVRNCAGFAGTFTVTADATHVAI